MSTLLERFRGHLAHADALLPISLAGLACGLVTGAVIIAFRILTESAWELPYIIGVGLIMGALAALFIHTIQTVDRRSRHLPLWLRTATAGAITGLCALAAPEVMGVGYDTVEASLLGEVAADPRPD